MKWPKASGNAFTAVLSLVDRMTSWWSTQIFDENIHSSAFCDLGFVSQRAQMKHYLKELEKFHPTEDLDVVVKKRTGSFSQFLANEDAEGRLSPAVKEFFREVRRRMEQDGASENVASLFNTLVSLYHLSTRQTKCYMVHYGPKMIGGVIYR